LPFDFFWQPFIVIVEKRNPLAPRFSNSSIARFSRPPVRVQLNYSHARVVNPIQNLDSLDIRAIDSYHHFDFAVRLHKSASYCPQKRGRASVGRNHCRHEIRFREWRSHETALAA
jgi:hypothetical protein